jgi:hypothetical protein
VSLKKGQTVLVTVRAPKSGEIFQIPLELADQPVGYDNFSEEMLREHTRLQIKAAVSRLKDPKNYAVDQGYSNIAAHEWGIGSKNPAAAQARKDKGFV